MTRVHAVEPDIRSDPDGAGAILVDGPYAVSAQAGRIAGLVLIVLEAVAVGNLYTPLVVPNHRKP